jgi:hypothetical protein
MSLSLKGQETAQVKKEQDGLQITYQFSELKGKRAEEGPQELCIVILNKNEYDVKVTFSLAFFKDGLVDEESAVIKLCIPSGKEMKGKKNGLCWLIDEDNDKKIKEDAFDWDLNDLTVEKTNSCK